MRTAAFVAGVEDVRNGRPPNYEAFNFSQDDDQAVKKTNAHWHYERGRQWALLAPSSMPLKINGVLNPKAIALFDAASKRNWVL